MFSPSYVSAAASFNTGGEEEGGGEDAFGGAGAGTGSKPLPEGEMGGTMSPSFPDAGGGVCW